MTIDMTGDMYSGTEGIYIVCLILALLLGICISVFGILLRKKIRMEFVYLMIVGGIVLDLLILLWGCVYGVICFL